MHTLKEKTKKVENLETIDSGTIEIGPKLLVLSRSYSMSNRIVQLRFEPRNDIIEGI